MPGLIEDAHLNTGMGHKFLRHIERTKVILMVIDINGFQLKSTQPYRSPLETLILLLQELLFFQDVLLERPIYLVINKMDTVGSDNKKLCFLNELEHLSKDHPLLRNHTGSDAILKVLNNLTSNTFENVFPVSAHTGCGMEKLKECLYHSLPSDDTKVDNNVLEDDLAVYN